MPKKMDCEFAGPTEDQFCAALNNVACYYEGCDTVDDACAVCCAGTVIKGFTERVAENLNAAPCAAAPLADAEVAKLLRSAMSKDGGKVMKAVNWGQLFQTLLPVLLSLLQQFFPVKSVPAA